MTIADVLQESDFSSRLHTSLSIAKPIKSIERLLGREDELERIHRALLAPGRHIFIYGDRGVGKSSLAHTAAIQYQSSDAAPILVSGSADETYNSVVTNIAIKALSRSRVTTHKTTSNASFQWRGLTLGGSSENSPVSISDQIRSVGDGVSLLVEVTAQHSKAPVIVIDEFDTIKDPNERSKFASMLKQLGDQEANFKMIFTGVAKSLDEMLGSHPSAFRQLETVELNRLGWDGRRDIAFKAAEDFGLSLNNDVCWRIAAISDGFPFFVHLVLEKMLWEAFVDKEVITELGANQFREGLGKAIASIDSELRRPYEQAVLHRHDEFEDIVWATADDEDLVRHLGSMYESYKVVCRKRTRTPIDRAKFTKQIGKLKTLAYGQILAGIDKRQGWSTYHLKMLRGYVRMQAEANGVELSGEKDAPRPMMHLPNAKSGYRGPSVPKTVRLRGDYDVGSNS